MTKVGTLDMTKVGTLDMTGRVINIFNLQTIMNTMILRVATIEWSEGEIVACALSFRTHEHNGQVYMDVIANEIYKIKG